MLKSQRSEQEMLDLILGFAENDARVRAVYMNGSRANPRAPRDIYQDYDIVYIVREFDSFLADWTFLDQFGKRLILQTPETMRYPDGSGHFNWMMLFDDGNRLDLTLIPIERPDLIGHESQTIVLLDKDGILPAFPPASDMDYHVKKPDALFYHSCCNNFWWCMQNVCKGLARDEVPYAMMMYHKVVLQELHDMLSWYIGEKNDFAVSPGKMGKYFKLYLEPELYARYLTVYSCADTPAVWDSLFAAADLFHTAAAAVGAALGYNYNLSDEEGMRRYMQALRERC